MADSTVTQVIDALLTRFASATSAQVVDGPVAVGAAHDYSRVHVGVSDWLGAEAADFSQTWHAIGGQRRKDDGQVFCRITVSSTGDDQKAVRDAAFAIFDDLNNDLRAGPDLITAPAIPTLPAEISDRYTLDQTPPMKTVVTAEGPEDRVAGRRAAITFAVSSHAII